MVNRVTIERLKTWQFTFSPGATMKKFLGLSTVLTILCSGNCATVAQEFEPRTSTSGVADFSGVGLGVDAGVGLGSAGQVNASGIIGGAHAGYNFQAQRLVGGIEVDFLTSRIRSGRSVAMSFNQTFLSSARVKAGYVFGDLLAYGTLGWAYSTSSYRDISGSANKTIKGTAFGGGLEYAVTRNLSVRGEYIHYTFGRQSYVTPLNVTPISASTNLLRAGASVHF